MAADYTKLVADLRAFYDFTGKIVLFVGAGGGQLLDPTVGPKKTIAIDSDRNALDELDKRLAAKGMREYFDIICGRFEEASVPGDAVYFEFCLHEMAEPY